jgi:hypothetical protein
VRPEAERRIVRHLAIAGLNASHIAYVAQIPRSTVREWLEQPERPRQAFPIFDPTTLPGREYGYLLGFYLGDGTISKGRKDVYRLRITTDARYHRIIEECAAAMAAVMPSNRVKVQQLPYKAVEINSYSKKWPLLFPQHGPGGKHTRKIVLAQWQTTILMRHPKPFLRGLIHSDGCRVVNHVNGRDYPRYFFTQVSGDIKRPFCDACDQLGIEYTFNSWKTVSIARRESVALLDSFVGPKS